MGIKEVIEQWRAVPESGPERVVVRGLELFGAFYVRERRAMVALAYATSRSQLAAEDISQDAFIAAFRDWERAVLTIRPHGSVASS